MTKNNTKLGIIFGTRPEIIKLAPVIWKCQQDNIPFFCIHTGQHYSHEMDQVFFETLGLPDPDYNLDIGKMNLGGHGPSTGMMMTEIEKILMKEMPDVVVVQGDTNSVLAGALVATKLQHFTTKKMIKVAHIEAGLRSYDRSMPEETNRIIVDHLADFLFVPTETQRNILLSEGINDNKIFVTGNTIVDAVTQIATRQSASSNILQDLELIKESYILLTLHRQENVDSAEILLSIIEGLRQISEISGVEIIFPIHPRTEKRLAEFNIVLPAGIRMIRPANYTDFISLQSNAQMILTDSGGVQEEACIFRVPCVTLRDNTERPETEDVGANYVSGTNSANILAGYHHMMSKEKNWDNPFGDGKAAEKILEIIFQKEL